MEKEIDGREADVGTSETSCETSQGKSEKAPTADFALPNSVATTI